MKKLIGIGLVIIAGNFGELNAQVPSVILSDKAGWHKIGERTVDLMGDHDEISVVGADRFAALKIIVREASINLYDLEVVFEGGDKQIVEVRNLIKAGDESKAYDIKGSERDLKKIILLYKTLPNQKEEKALVEIWGLKTNSNAVSATVPVDPLIVSDKAGWQKIGEHKGEGPNERHEIVILGSGRFSAIKFIVKDESMEIKNLEVYYKNGTKEDIQFISTILKGEESRIIDLNGGERILEKIVFGCSSKSEKPEGKAQIELWGLKANVH